MRISVARNRLFRTDGQNNSYAHGGAAAAKCIKGILMDMCGEQAGRFVAQKIDDLFLNGLRIKQEDAPKVMKHFAFLDNTLYFLGFEKPLSVLSFSGDEFGIEVQHINLLHAHMLGQVIRDELGIKEQDHVA